MTAIRERANICREEFTAMRIAKGYSQAQAAQALHVAAVTFTAWESGVYPVPAYAVVALAEVPAIPEVSTRRLKQRITRYLNNQKVAAFPQAVQWLKRYSTTDLPVSVSLR